MDEVTTIAALKQSAYGLLAKRDYSVAELTAKLKVQWQKIVLKKGTAEREEDAPDDSVNAVISECLERGYLDDARFAAQFVRSRVGRGHGPNRIRQDMRNKQLGSLVIDGALFEAEVDWSEEAQKALEKKFGVFDQKDYAQKSKAYRFLLQRGFLSEHVEAALARNGRSNDSELSDHWAPEP